MSLVLDIRHDGPRLDVQTELPAGAITALVGPSGSGKTSLLRVIAGLLTASRTHIAMADDVWDDAQIHRPTRLRPIGLVSQHYGLFPHLSAQGNVETALLHLPGPERAQHARVCLQLARVAELSARKPRQLSGGQKQRVALARAIARQPTLLLLDEPFSAVDRATRKALYAELRQLHAQLGMTVLLVTHDLAEAAQLASHLVLLDAGQVVQAGPAPQVLTRPANVRAAQLLDIPNIFLARLGNTPHGLRLHWGPHTLELPQDVRRPDGPCRFAVLPENVLLIRPDKPMIERPNTLKATVRDARMLGVEAQLELTPEGLAGADLHIRLPTRALERQVYEPGTGVQVCLRPADIVLLEQ